MSRLERPLVRRVESVGALAFLIGVCLFLTACDPDARRDVNSRVSPSAEVPASCPEHGLPEAVCTGCNPALAAVFQAKGDWCAEHGVPESFCPTCNPGAAGAGAQPSARRDWCAEHGLPESQCTRCSPDLTAGLMAQGDWCAEHEFPESVCPVCNPVLVIVDEAGGRPGHGSRIRFRSPEIERAVGITTTPAREAALGLMVECTARIEFNQDSVADVRAPLAGLVRVVHVALGEAVEAGQALFGLESPNVGDLQGRLRAIRHHVQVARVNLEREESLHEARISSQRDVELARQEYETELAEQRAVEASLRIGGGSANGQGGRTTLRSPLAGIVVRRPATVGTYATVETSLATIVDTSTVWGLLDVREDDVARVQVGQRVSMEVDGLPGQVYEGVLTWVSPEVDARTRTVTARVEFPNPDGQLRAHQFARARVHTAQARDAVVVPAECIQGLAEEQVVFVRARGGVYDTVPVTLGRRTATLVEVFGPVLLGDEVVTVGAFLLKTELLKDSIGAGCCDVEDPGDE